MEEKQLHELHVLRLGGDYITNYINNQINALTEKACNVRLDSDERHIASCKRLGLIELREALIERKNILTKIQKREAEHEKA